MKAYKLLLGSIGDDSHSVGMALLRIAFREAGFYVKHLGILNTLDDFFFRAEDFDAIFISCMNGHVDLYLQDFPQKLKAFNLGNSRPRVWYLGGNLSVQEPEEAVVRRYLRMGFDYVAPKPVSWDVIYNRLMRDFHSKEIKEKHISNIHDDENQPLQGLDGVDDTPLTDAQYLALRKVVLSYWLTGDEVYQADVLKNHSEPKKNLHHVILSHMNNGNMRPLIQPRTGVAHVKDEIDILWMLREHGLDISSIQLDAASRKKMFRQAEEGVYRTQVGGTSFLNGFPVPIHGVKGIEQIMGAIDTPFQIRAGSPDHRFVYEIGLAGGASSIEGGFICYLFPYDKSTSPVETLQYWKYIDKLAQWYLKHYNVVVNREYFGALTCCLIEPTIPICINIVQSLLSARAGVKCISVGIAEQGNRSQDIAAIRVLDKLTREYLAKYGIHDCTVSTVYHQYMSAFPTDIAKARNIITNSSITCTLARATRIMTKTPVESIHIPTKEDNAEGLDLTRKGIEQASSITFNRNKVQQEIKIIEKQVRAVMGVIEELGQGSLARGALRAFQEGVLDVPFSPSIYNRNRLLTAKDKDGAIRFVNPEIMPFDNQICDFHNEKIQERKVLERATKVYELLEKDLTRIWKNDFRQWPLDESYLS